MKRNDGILNILSRLPMCVMSGVLGGLLCVGGVCAADNGCSDPDKDRITPTVALCSTHVYNTGKTTNPATDSEKQLMRDVIALKSTLITQQMKKQYDFLDATVRRLKTQLQKAVLTTGLEAAGATTSSDGTSANTNRNIALIGANDCVYKSSEAEVISCLQGNLNVIRNAVASGNMGEAKRQLSTDIDASIKWELVKDADLQDCKSDSLKANRTSMEACIQEFNVKLSLANKKINDSNNTNSWAYMMGGR